MVLMTPGKGKTKKLKMMASKQATSPQTNLIKKTPWHKIKVSLLMTNPIPASLEQALTIPPSYFT